MTTRVEIDGSMLEGGGQILRTAVCLSAVTGKPVRIYNIRAKRSPPGLRPQHLTAIQAVAKLTSAGVEGLRVGSREVIFSPNAIKSGSYLFNIGTAGSVTLILQALLPVAAFASTEISVELQGGTNNPWAPPIDYAERVLLPTLSRMGFKGHLQVLKRGFYPEGGGIVRVKVQPTEELKPLRLTEFSEVVRVKGLAYSCRLPCHIVERMARSAEKVIGEMGFNNLPLQVSLECLQAKDAKCAVNQGCGIILCSSLKNGAIVAADNLGERGKPAERVGAEAAENLATQLKSGAPVDYHLADQLVVWMSLASGCSEIRTSRLTLHALTAVEICRQITGARFEVSGEEGNPGVVKCSGIGHRKQGG